ncbi:MAG: alpha/beta fold hydrolase [Solirubrobacterales bacterium]
MSGNGATPPDGAGEPLLLIHGLGASSRVWDPVVELLAPERRVLLLDMPGFGAAPPLPADTEPSPVNLAAALHRRCLELGAPRPHVAGNSLGAWVGLEMGRADWAASVTALSPAGLWKQPLGPRRRDPHRWARRFRPAVAAALRSRPLRERMVATFAARPERVPARTGRQLVLGWIDSTGYRGANRAMRTHLFDPAGYPEDVPVTIAWGVHDRLVGPPRPQRRPAGTRFLVLPGVGHTPTWDDPELVARTLLEGSSSVSSEEPAQRTRGGAP